MYDFFSLNVYSAKVPEVLTGLLALQGPKETVQTPHGMMFRLFATGGNVPMTV